jgi:hypothetical protein
MKKVKVKLDFSPMSTVVMIDFGSNIVLCLGANPIFPTPDVLVTELNASLTVLKNKHTLALTGSIEGKEGVVIARKAFEKLLKLEALYVDRIADGNEEMIASSGFHHSKRPVSANRPEFRVLSGNAEGSIVLIRKAVKGAATYVWQRAANPLPQDESQWIQTGISKQAKCVIDNLEVGTKYWFRVAAVTKNGIMPWCEPIMKMVV